MADNQAESVALRDDEKSILMNAAHELDRTGCACQPVWDAVEQIIAARLDDIEGAIREGAGAYVGPPDRWGLQERRDIAWRDRLRAALSIAREEDRG